MRGCRVCWLGCEDGSNVWGLKKGGRYIKQLEALEGGVEVACCFFPECCLYTDGLKRVGGSDSKSHRRNDTSKRKQTFLPATLEQVHAPYLHCHSPTLLLLCVSLSNIPFGFSYMQCKILISIQPTQPFFPLLLPSGFSTQPRAG